MIYFTLFLEFFKIGLFTFGGGYAMVPLLREVVLKYNWLSEERFYDFIGICESTPGPIAVNMATYVGSTQGGFLGSLVSTFAVILPSFIIILLIASILKKFIKNKYVNYFLDGIKPIVLALILATGISLSFKSVFNGYTNISFNIIPLIIILALTSIYFIFKYLLKKKLNSIFIILIAAALGIVLSILMN
jgi:chromate transporter